MRNYKSLAIAVSVGLGAIVNQAQAYNIYTSDEGHLDATLESMIGLFHSRENYAQTGSKTGGSSNWQEGYIKYGFKGDLGVSDGTAYGALNMLSSATWGDGDAGGFTNGDERTTKVEDAYAGWRSGGLFPFLGQDGVDFSVGRQQFVAGDGFIISNDGINYGKSVTDGSYDRGGAYYLAARKAFDQTAILRLGGKSGWRSDLAWLKSDNPAQAKMEMAVGTLEHVSDSGTFGLTYVHGLDIDQRFTDFIPSFAERDGMKTYSVRYIGNAGLDPDLHVAGEYAWQDKDSGRQNAWYLESGWTFSETTWTPTVTYRYSRFSKDYDPLLFGFSRGYGTWFQGEVAANYAGPFNANTKVHYLSLDVIPTPGVKAGLRYYHFDNVSTEYFDTSGREVDAFVEWVATEHVVVTPLVGLYQPRKSASDRGLQLDGNASSLYGQLTLAFNF
ncbi:alginate export family protein [Pseudomonas sp. GL-RE-19]|uniref:alginate export family protein n=1 Tax=Pseudomonas sp. GL-RE-19 TaxID=2832389 RepID=UPI001CBE6AE6|nr:alginate export family protein [Pseudomonas sp. GL-RE-19]